MLRRLVLLAASSGVLVATPALAQASDDVRCLVLSNAFANGASAAEAKRVAQSSATYYLGRIDGRWNDAQLRAALARQQQSIKAATAGKEMQACVQRMQASARKLTTLAPPPTQRK
jgi:alpha-beta hydrolase superfamily lysophospholipase